MLFDLDRAYREFDRNVRFGGAKKAIEHLKAFDDKRYYRLYAIDLLKPGTPGTYKSTLAIFHNSVYNDVINAPDATAEDKKEAYDINQEIKRIESMIFDACNRVRSKILAGESAYVVMTGGKIKPSDLKKDVYAEVKKI